MAVSITTTAAGTTINSTGGVTESFNSVYQYIQTLAAATKSTITRTGDTGSFTYSVNKTTPNPFRSLTFAANSKIRIDSGSLITFDKTDATLATILSVSDNAVLNIQQGSVIYLGAAARSLFYGAVSASGTVQRPIIVSNSVTTYLYPYMESVWNNIIFRNDYVITSGGGTDLLFSQQINKAETLTFTNLTVTSSIVGGNYGYPMYFTAGGMYTNIVIDGFTISNKKNCILNYQSTAKLKNGIINAQKTAGNSSGILFACAGNVVSPAYQTSVDDTLFPTGRFQSVTTLQNVTISNPSAACTLGGLTNNYNGYIYLKNCTFIKTDGTLTYGAYSTNGSITLQSGSTYIGNWTNPRFGWSTNGTFLQVHQVSITVIDDSTQLPIQNATVTVLQGSDPPKERWFGLTNAEGKLVNVFGDPMLLVDKQQNSSTTLLPWSDNSASGLHHKIMVAVSGYCNYQQIVYVTQSFSKQIRLAPASDTSLPYIQIGNGIIL